MDDKQTCRLCLIQTSIWTSLLEDDGVKMLENLTSIKISTNESHVVCIKCWLNLKLAFRICQNFIEADQKLHAQEHLNTLELKTENELLIELHNEDISYCELNFDNRSSVETEEIIKIKVEECSSITGSDNNATNKCPICAENQNASTLYLHLKEHYRTKQKCDICRKNLKDIQAYRQHLLASHNYFPEIYACETCHSTFQYKSFYTLHMKNFHVKPVMKILKQKKPKKDSHNELDMFVSEETGLLKCSECQKSFSCKKTYCQHVKGHEKAKCNICGTEVTKYNLSKHIMLHSSGPSVCHLCGITLKNIESLRGHLHYTHSNKKLDCEYCGKIFTKLYTRRLHIKREHTGEKSYVCDTCGKSFFTQFTLNKHVKMTHLKLRPHICQYCQKGFSSRFAMRTHERQHTQETPYVCSLCGEGFRQNVSLKAHKKSKHNIIENKTFDCKVCNKMFGSEWAVKSHMRLH